MPDVQTEGMERIHYAGGTILTGTEISRALLEYAAALARRDTSATVDVPVRDENGRLTNANLLVGPASQLISVHEEGAEDEVVAPEFVAELHAKTRLLGPRRAIADGEVFAEDGMDDFESPSFEEHD
jgi:hypothetical protein